MPSRHIPVHSRPPAAPCGTRFLFFSSVENEKSESPRSGTFAFHENRKGLALVRLQRELVCRTDHFLATGYGRLGEALALAQLAHGLCTLKFLLELLEHLINAFAFFHWNDQHVSFSLRGCKYNGMPDRCNDEWKKIVGFVE